MGQNGLFSIMMMIRQYIQEDSLLDNHSCKDIKSYMSTFPYFLCRMLSCRYCMYVHRPAKTWNHWVMWVQCLDRLPFINKIVCRVECFHASRPLPACDLKGNTLHIWERPHWCFHLVPDHSMTAMMMAIKIMIVSSWIL
jgi:hypothetical protein